MDNANLSKVAGSRIGANGRDEEEHQLLNWKAKVLEINGLCSGSSCF